MWWSFHTNSSLFSQFGGGISASVFWQIIALAVVTGIVSLLLRRILLIKVLETTFQSSFQKHLDHRKQFILCPNQHFRDMLYQASDQELNEDFNSYLAQRFVQQTLIYILPLLLSLSWLDNSLPTEGYSADLGKPFIMVLPLGEYGIPGIPFPILFLIAYILILALGMWRDRQNRTSR